MYKILGGDGKEYGPVTADTLRQWLAEGRANAQTMVLAEGGSNWVALGSLPEFAAAPVAPAWQGGVADPGLARDKARRLANPAGWALIVVGILGVLMSIGLVVWTLVAGVQSNPLMDQLMNSQASSDAARVGQKIGYTVALVIGIGWAAFIAFAGWKLRQLQSWGVALTGAILAVIPCCGSQFPLCILSLPIGIWAIVILCRNDVKSQFS
jgi:hypothetical protein